MLLTAAILSWRTAISPRPARYAPIEQPIPFSHKHHAGDDGIDCRYCHSNNRAEGRRFRVIGRGNARAARATLRRALSVRRGGSQ